MVLIPRSRSSQSSFAFLAPPGKRSAIPTIAIGSCLKFPVGPPVLPESETATSVKVAFLVESDFSSIRRRPEVGPKFNICGGTSAGTALLSPCTTDSQSEGDTIIMSRTASTSEECSELGNTGCPDTVENTGYLRSEKSGK